MTAVRTFALGLLIGLQTSVVIADSSPKGCFARTYSDAHLAKNPKQVVKSIAALFVPPEPGKEGGNLRLKVQMANQGHAKREGMGGKTFDDGLYCYKGKPHWQCVVECDGGVLRVIRSDADGLLLRTSDLRLGDNEGCGGVSNLAEVTGEPVTYKLKKTTAAQCPAPY